MSGRATHAPALRAAFAAAIGIIIGRMYPGYSTVFFSASLACVVVCAANFLFGKDRRTFFIAVPVYLSLVLSFAFYMSLQVSALDDVHPGDFTIFSGTIDDTPRDSVRLSLTLKNCYGFKNHWRQIDGELVLTPTSKIPVDIGDRIIFKGESGVVSAARNPGEFDLKSFYRIAGIAGRVYLTDWRDVIAIDRAKGFNFTRSVIAPIRNYVRGKIDAFLPGDIAGLAKAMVLGERAGIDRQVNEQFINTGTVHILSVSGLHIGFLSGILITLASLARVPRRRRFFIIAPLLILYGLVVGMVPSVFRAIIMALVVLLGIFLQRRSTIVNSLGFAALVILVISPSQLFMPGFQLSFAAVLSIAYFYERLLAMIKDAFPKLGDRPWLTSAVSISVLTLSATLGTVPLTAYYFDRISVVSVLANFFIVPLSGIFMSLCFTFLVFGLISNPLASIYAAAAETVGFLTLGINSLLGSMSVSSVHIGDAPLLFGVLYLLWISAVIGFGGRSIVKKVIFAALLAANLILYAAIFSNRTEARLYVLDVGQGDAIFVELPDGKTMLVDAGMKFGRNDAAERAIVPFLRRKGISRLDYFVVTHLHNDHIGGAATILRSVKVGSFIHPDQLSGSATWRSALASLRMSKSNSSAVKAGTVLDSGEAYRIYVLHPNPRYTGPTGLSYRTRFNNGSVVLRVCVGRNSFLLAGDIEQPVEHGLVRVYGRFLSSGILKAGHHGSSTGSSAEFLEAVHPMYAVISVGRRNSFGHPSAEVIARMRRSGIRVWRTDSLGAAFFRVSPNKSEAVEWR